MSMYIICLHVSYGNSKDCLTGMANLGKGGVLFEDDTPDVNAREGILDKPAAMTAAGALENSRMPEESRFEARGADQGYGLGRPVAYAAQDGGG